MHLIKKDELYTSLPLSELGLEPWDQNLNKFYLFDKFKANKYKGKVSSDTTSTFSTLSDNVTLNLSGRAITSDYYAFLAGAKQFEDPERHVINLFATPGIDYVNAKDLSTEILEMLESDLQTLKTDEAKKYRIDEIMDWHNRIKELDPTYIIPSRPTPATPGGCYIATAVYGSYDCPEVWTLRRFRDFTLAESWYGRAFIKIYYAVSPTLVKWFGKTSWFKKMWKGKLDRMVANLNAEGVEDTPYEDKIW